jgi:hypothetical protein
MKKGEKGEKEDKETKSKKNGLIIIFYNETTEFSARSKNFIPNKSELHFIT